MMCGMWQNYFDFCSVEQNKGNTVFGAGAVPRAPQVIGLTGGIGAGKTTVCRIFESLGVPVWSADDAAKRCYEEDVELRASVVARFGPAVFVSGELDRGALAKVAEAPVPIMAV